MKASHSALTVILATTLSSSLAFAQSAEEVRLRGFAKHQKDQVQFEKARVQGERAYLETEDQWETQKTRELEAYKKGKRQVSMSEDGPEAKADAVAKKAFTDSYEESRRNYLQKRTNNEITDRKQAGLPTESQELGLDQDLPRYDYRKRAMFGAPSKYGKPGSSGSSGSSFSSGGGGGNSFPPPPTFDDFNDGGYVPAPNMPDDFGDVPPPPPAPSFGEDGGLDEFPPPPPPPIFENNDF